MLILHIPNGNNIDTHSENLPVHAMEILKTYDSTHGDGTQYALKYVAVEAIPAPDKKTELHTVETVSITDDVPKFIQTELELHFDKLKFIAGIRNVMTYTWANLGTGVDETIEVMIELV